ncbi:hypothetical protein ES705_22748 [subsurface metagenome]
MKTFKIQGSNDAISWTDLKSCSSDDNSNWQEWTFSNTTAYRYIQMIASESWDIEYGGICEVSEAEMMISFLEEEAKWLPIKVDLEGKVILSP